MRILVVDDEPAVRTSLERTLVQAGYEVSLASNGREAMSAIGEGLADAVILDVMMPGLDGIEVTRRVRRMGDETPVLLLTARQGVSDRVEGLDAGADDYLTKPFALEELLARVRALLRRSVSEAPTELSTDGLVLDVFSHRATRDGESLNLTRTEFSLLELFMRNPGRVLSRSLIYEHVWGYDFGPSSNSLDVYIGYLRRKTEEDGKPRLIQTVRGVGFVLRAE